jgi:hypothetical protein
MRVAARRRVPEDEAQPVLGCDEARRRHEDDDGDPQEQTVHFA